MRERMSNIGRIVAGVAMGLSLLPLEAMAQQSFQVQKINLPTVVTKTGYGFINDSGQMAIPYYDSTQFVYKLSFIDRGVITPVTGMRIREFNNLGKMSGYCDMGGACIWGKATGYTIMGSGFHRLALGSHGS